VTPIILDNREQHPWIWVLEALPLYDSIARMKSQDHWQTDVIAGWALGTAVGYWASRPRCLSRCRFAARIDGRVGQAFLRGMKSRGG